MRFEKEWDQKQEFYFPEFDKCEMNKNDKKWKIQIVWKFKYFYST